MTFYLIFKVVHIFAMVSWMAGMLYLPRIFVYHSNKNNSKEMNETFVTMEYKLLKYIMNPAMIATWVFGILLLIHPYSSVNIYSFWFLVKVFFVILMTVFHAYYAYCRKKMLLDNLFKSSRYYKIINEIPAFLLILILIMVIIKPYG